VHDGGSWIELKIEDGEAICGVFGEVINQWGFKTLGLILKRIEIRINIIPPKIRKKQYSEN
jgi:hypothetical protein